MVADHCCISLIFACIRIGIHIWLDFSQMHLGLAGGRRDQTKPREWLNTDQGKKGGAGEKIKFKNHKGILFTALASVLSFTLAPKDLSWKEELIGKGCAVRTTVP